jgi:hypothetical protein
MKTRDQLNQEWDHFFYPQQQGMNHNLAPRLPSPYLPPLPNSGVEIEMTPGGDFKICLTTTISAEAIAETKEKAILVEIALVQNIRDAVNEILGKLALARLQKPSEQNQGQEGKV